MSRKDQEAWLAGVEKTLEQEVAKYRRYNADKRTHNFSIAIAPLIKGVRDTLTKEKVPEDTIKKVTLAVIKDLQGVIKAVHDKVEQNKTQYANVRKIQYIPGFVYNAIFYATAGKEEGQLKKIYSQAFKTYETELDDIALKISKLTGDLGSNAPSQRKKYWNLSHAKNEGVGETQIRDALDAGMRNTSTMSHAEMMAYLNFKKVDLTVIRDTKSEIMTVGVGSFLENKDDATITKMKIALFKEVVANIKDQLNSQKEKIAEMPGSDSFKTRHTKKLLKEVTDPFIKVGKVKTQNLALKNSRVKTKNKNKKVTGGGALLVAKKSRSKKSSSRTRTSSTSFNPLQMVAMINKKLPQTVLKNMGEPGLVSRTGRFASSVRATDVVKTPKGFPSVGYTYQRNPYEVFELGNPGPWATPERDPRKVIDQSIREIAVEFAMGRFYTRRV